MRSDRQKAKRIIFILAITYVTFGFMFGMNAWLFDLRTFKCIDADAPYGYIGMGTGSFRNPDPENCTRRGLELHSIAIVPIFTVAWSVMIGGRVINSLSNQMMD